MGVVYIGDMSRWLIVILLLAAQVHATDILEGRAVSIAGGDTFTLLTADKQRIKIRLAEIDAPERGQPYGAKSRQALAALIMKDDIRVVVQTTDRYGRIVGRPFSGDLDICETMVRIGAAWVYREYVVDRKLFDVENDARKRRRGVWGLSETDNQPPWEWRRHNG